ncbi:MAG: TrkH family potassium uptake protein [Erysipelotrichaceae bacterium]|nr:TrkH family potassium uptake protein [Erysipelotrichaceae bacterium]
MNKSFIRYIFSIVITVESLFLILVSGVSLIYHEPVFFEYFITGVIFLILGIIGYRKKFDSYVFFAKEGFITVAGAWILMSVIGAIPLFITGEIPNFIDAVFEVVSGFTTTGSTIVDDVTALTHASLFWRSFTHWIGGMGVLVFVLAIFPSAGGRAIHVMRAESPGPSVGKLVPKIKDTAIILYSIYAGLTLIEIICMKLCGMPWFDSITLSFATAGTGGFGILNESFISYSSSVQIVATIFMILFGINFNIYYLILIGKLKDAFKSTELKCYLGIIVIASLGIAINTFNMFGSIFEALKHSFFQVASIMTTTGFASYDFDLWPMYSKTILILLMFIGACAGSTGGGIKVSRIVIICQDLANTLRQYIHPRQVKVVRFEGKPVDKETVNSIRAYIAFYMVIYFVSLLLISVDNLDFTTNFAAVAATINNIGPGLNLVGPSCNFNCFDYFSKIVLIFDMLAGRLELIPLLILFAPFTYSKKEKKV